MYAFHVTLPWGSEDSQVTITFCFQNMNINI